MTRFIANLLSHFGSGTSRRPSVVTAHLRLEQFEPREMPSVVMNNPLPGGPYFEGQWVILANQILVAPPGGSVAAVVYSSGPRSGDLSDDLADTFLIIDAVGPGGQAGPDGIPDVVVPGMEFGDDIGFLTNVPLPSGLAVMSFVGRIAPGADGPVGVAPDTIVAGNGVWAVKHIGTNPLYMPPEVPPPPMSLPPPPPPPDPPPPDPPPPDPPQEILTGGLGSQG